MTVDYNRIFSYYGAKSKIVDWYPKPVCETIIEPFCGGASYSVAHHRKDIFLNDKDDVTASVWRFLLRPDALQQVYAHVPEKVVQGSSIDEILDPLIDSGLRHLIRGEISTGLGQCTERTIVSGWGERDWHQVLRRLVYWIPKISHWTFQSGDYTSIPNQEATWFIDPPYANAAGSIYRTNDVDYRQLGEWCRSRLGQVIVCENEGASWLPFEHLTKRAGSFSGRDHLAKASGNEVIYLQGLREPDLFDFA